MSVFLLVSLSTPYRIQVLSVALENVPPCLRSHPKEVWSRVTAEEDVEQYVEQLRLKFEWTSGSYQDELIDEVQEGKVRRRTSRKRFKSSKGKREQGGMRLLPSQL